MDKKHVEALLFVSKEPLTVERMAKLLEEEEKVVLRWLFELQNEYKDRGIRIRQVAGGFEMVSADDCVDAVEKVVQKEYEQLAPSIVKTISIVAYNQPAPRALIKKLRNVKDPDYGINLSLEKKLIVETPEGYVTTDAFLKYYGINDLKELPPVTVPSDSKVEAPSEEKEEENNEKSD